MESKKELDALLLDESLANVPFLVLRNKIFEDECLTSLHKRMGKVNRVENNVRPLELFMCSIVRKMGYGEGFRWLSQYIK